MITIQTVKSSNINLPVVHRYINKEYTDLFFEKGIIRLGSFNRFRQYPDEVKGDKSEGKGSIKRTSVEGFQFIGVTEVGNDSYIFCTSYLESIDLMNVFKTDGYFKIKDPLNFSLAVSNSIPGFLLSAQGLCNYQDIRIIDRPTGDMSIKDFTDEKGELIIGGSKMMNRLGEMVSDGMDLMFLKEKKYQNQVEYRFIWKINTQYFQIHDFLDIECKEAIQFCEKVS